MENCYATGDVSGEDCVGGVVGYNCQGTLENCVALNPNIKNTVNLSLGRIRGLNSGDILINNYGRNNMKKNDSGTTWTTDIGPGDKNGANITTANWSDANWWKNTSNWSTVNGGSAWDFINVWDWNSTTNLPILRNMPVGTQNPVVQ